MGTTRVVAWMDDAEWEAVYHQLFYGKKEQIRTALDVIAVWRVRFAGRIPVAIEATTQLLESHLLEGDENCMAKRQSMSAAVSQFVGLLTERSLKGQLYTTPMHVRGEELGIPEWITTLRHDAAHGFVPPYVMLDKGVKFAIEWLRANHWEKHLRRQKVKRTPKKYKEKKQKHQRDAIDDGSVEENLSRMLRNHFENKGRKSVDKKSSSLESYLSEKERSPEMLVKILISHNFIPLQIADNVTSKFYVGNTRQRIQLSAWAKIKFSTLSALLLKLNVLHLLVLEICEELAYSYTSVELCTIWVDFFLEFLSDSHCPDALWAKVITRLLEAKANNHILQKVLDITQIMGSIKYDPNNREQILEQLRPLSSDCNQCCDMDTVFVNPPETRDEELSWTLCEFDTKDETFGLMTGQDKTNFWKSLFCYELKSPVIENACDSGDSVTVTQFIDSPEIDYFIPPCDSQRPVFSNEQIEQFCTDIDLL